MNVMCKVFWTNETWSDRYVLTFLVSFRFVLQKLTFRSCFSAVSKFLLLHPFFRDLGRYLKQASFYHGHWIVPGVWYSFLVLIFVVVLPFMVFGLLTLFSHGWRLSKSFECRLLLESLIFHVCLKMLCWMVWTWCAKMSGPMKPDCTDVYWHLWFVSK